MIPTTASTTVSSSPPHRCELTDGSAVAPNPLISANDTGSDTIQAQVSARRGIRTRSEIANAIHVSATLRARAPAATTPSGETSMSAASISCSADSVTASARVARPYAAAERPLSTEMIASSSQMRHAWSAGYWPMRNSRRLSVMTVQRASVTAHPPMVMASQTSAATMRTVTSELIGPLNRFARIHATGPTVSRGGGSVSAVIARGPGRGGCRCSSAGW